MTISSLLDRKGSDVSTIRETEPVAAAIGKLYDERIGVLVVVDRWGQIVGMFSERDVVRGLAHRGVAVLEDRVGAVMTADVTVCARADRIDKVMAVMTAHRIRHLPVVDDGRLAGLVSMGDLVKHRLDEKESEANVLLDIARVHR